MEFIFGVISGACICSVVFTMKLSSRDSKKKEKEFEYLENMKVLEEHRNHKYLCSLCDESFSYNDAVIQGGNLCCPYCGKEINDNGYYG